MWISHIDDAEKLSKMVDAILVRNTGPQIFHQKSLMALKKRTDLALFNDLCGKGDINGKYHLRELYESGFPVIPTFFSKDEVKELKDYKQYLLKPLDGADSCDIKILTTEELLLEQSKSFLIQPLFDFQYEVSFYFIGKQFQYSLYAPNPQKRWELKPYIASKDDINFALKFINWNTCKIGIQRVDACRLHNEKLLLMELEDYNPFLSLDLLQHDVKEQFLKTLCMSLEELINKKQ